MNKYSVILTNQGLTRLAAVTANNEKLSLSKMAFGDSAGVLSNPTPEQTALINEVYRTDLSDVSINNDNTHQLVIKAIIPTDVGGWWIREIGIYDESNILIAIASCPESYKPILAEGAGTDQIIELTLTVSNIEKVNLTISQKVLATKDDVHKEMSLGTAKILPDNGIYPGAAKLPLEISSSSGKISLGINDKGELISPAGFSELLGIKVLQFPEDSDYLFAIDDESGRNAFAVGKDGSVEILGLKLERANIENLIEIVDENNSISSGIDNLGNIINPETAKFNIKKDENYDFPERLHIIVYGQSLSVGAQGTPILSTPVSSTLMYDTGVISLGKKPTNLIPLKENRVETLASGFAHGFVSHIEQHSYGMAGRELILNAAGVSGERIRNLGKGKPAYNDVINQIIWCQELHKKDGKEYSPDYIIWLQGEADAGDGMSGAEYKKLLSQLRKDLEMDLATIRGDKPLLMFTYQMASHGFYVGTAEHSSVEIPLAHLEISHEDEYFRCFGPNYMFAGSDNVHKTNHGYRQIGLQVEKAIRHEMLTGRPFRPLEPKVALMLSERVIMVEFNVPVPPMVFDNTIVKQLPDGANGFEVHDDTGRIPIVSTEIIGGHKLKITTNRNLIGSVFVAAGYTPDNRGEITENRYKSWFSGPTTGVRTTLRDSDTTETDLSGLDGKNYSRHNYCVHFHMRVKQ